MILALISWFKGLEAPSRYIWFNNFVELQNCPSLLRILIDFQFLGRSRKYVYHVTLFLEIDWSHLASYWSYFLLLPENSDVHSVTFPTLVFEIFGISLFQEDSVKFCFSEDAITILLDVLLFKPIQHISYVFDTIRVFTLLLSNLAAFEMMYGIW